MENSFLRFSSRTLQACTTIFSLSHFISKTLIPSALHVACWHTMAPFASLTFQVNLLLALLTVVVFGSSTTTTSNSHHALLPTLPSQPTTAPSTLLPSCQTTTTTTTTTNTVSIGAILRDQLATLVRRNIAIFRRLRQLAATHAYTLADSLSAALLPLRDAACRVPAWVHSVVVWGYMGLHLVAAVVVGVRDGVRKRREVERKVERERERQVRRQRRRQRLHGTWV
ncbi:hypothetical protein IWX48DRAFT_636409 [Phyllosticta citricarpa]